MSENDAPGFPNYSSLSIPSDCCLTLFRLSCTPMISISVSLVTQTVENPPAM